MQIKRIIPNSLTCANLLCGSAAVFMATQEQFLWAFALILAGGLFDFFDGASARWLKVPSPLGIQLDSLADDITFGLAPAMILFCYLKPIIGWWALIALLIAAFSALRLAKFNIDTRQTNTFIGLPTPANALFWSSLITGGGAWLNELNAGWVLLLGLIALFSYFLVSEIPMFSLKFKNLSWRSNRIRYIFLLCCLPMLLLGFLAPVAIISWYLLLSVGLYLKGERV